MYPVAILLLCALTAVTVLMVLQNTIELLVGVKALPLSTRVSQLLLNRQYTVLLFSFTVCTVRPPLWSSGQSSWLQIRRPGFDSRHYQKKNVVALEQGPLSLVSTTEKLLDRKVAAPV
jgi:hypothetical protein